ncbi:hypothetical protein FA13DRAFT_1762243 [Coprinellus micaceus]|uniref:Mini-chromosome maintenance complex-binding protein n=1 Tax=Coprinellus micaceus TaxID=71717 RepID=A0A4Y7TPZ7_COPMI|nr:hypothetical protein FA13DRAFT_1762243 [Coprinellus micaceus]
MVSSILVDALAHPSQAIQDLADDGGDLNELPIRVSKYFSDVFASPDAFNEITVLDPNTPLESLKPRTLVRFDGMVQDTACSPEIYLSRRDDGRVGGWGSYEHDDAGDDTKPVDYNLLRECNVVWAVSIPGQSSWCRGGSEVASTDSKPLLPHKYPHPSSPHLGLQVKVYDSTFSESLRTTDLHSFVGVLTSDPWHTASDAGSSTLVPTIHLLFARKIAPTLVPRAFPDSSFESPVQEVREQLVAWIADEALAGDKLAAEWVLISLVSKVQSRTPPILPLSLTLSGYGASKGQRPRLIEVLSHLVPMVSVLPITLDTVNTTAFVPESKDEDLHSGWLQQPKGSLCVLSEVALDEGTVSEKGVYNLRMVQETMATQTLDYVFPFSQFSFEADINFIVLASGRKSAFFQTQLQIPVQGAAEAGLYIADNRPVRLPSPQALSEYRKLIGGAKIANVTLDERTANFIQDDFVKARQAGASRKNAGNTDNTVTPDDLIVRMMAARLLAASYPQTRSDGRGL